MLHQAGDGVQAALGTASPWKQWAAQAEQDTEHLLTQMSP